MTSRKYLLVGFVIVMVALMFVRTVRDTLFGWLSGEACYRGLPTRYWRWRCQCRDEASARLQRQMEGDYGPPPSQLETFLQRKGIYDWHDELRDPFSRNPDERQRKDDPEALPVLIQLLDDEDGEIRSAAIHTIWGLEGAEKAIPALTRLLERETDPHNRFALLGVLSTFGPAAAPAVPSMIPSLRDAVPELRSRAAAALFEIGPNAKAAIPALLQALHDPDEDVRRTSGIALKAIDPQVAAAAGIE
jgi:hypothetical protein